VIENSAAFTLSQQLFEEYRADNIIRRLQIILDDINAFFDGSKNYPPNIQSLTRMRVTKLQIQRIFDKLQKKYFSGNK
jgi:hypothetical protein